LISSSKMEVFIYKNRYYDDYSHLYQNKIG
jgi:hypothetical protein